MVRQKEMSTKGQTAVWDLQGFLLWTRRKPTSCNSCASCMPKRQRDKSAAVISNSNYPNVTSLRCRRCPPSCRDRGAQELDLRFATLGKAHHLPVHHNHRDSFRILRWNISVWKGYRHQSAMSFTSFPMHEFGNPIQKWNSAVLLETTHPEKVNRGW